MKGLLITVFIALLAFSGCTQRVVPKKELVCVEQFRYPYGDNIKIRVHPDDVELVEARSEYLEGGFEFYEKQVERNNALCKKDK